jgi:hypothetical protein
LSHELGSVNMKNNRLSRRSFLQIAALSLGALTGRSAATVEAGGAKGISLIRNPADDVGLTTPVVWAIEELALAISATGVTVRHFSSIEQAPRSDLCVVVTGTETALVSAFLKNAGAAFPTLPESLAVVPLSHDGQQILLACGKDTRGLMYALLELADRVRHGGNAQQSLRFEKPISEQPFNEVRSIGRLFVSDVEDKPWFNDRKFWQAYFGMLAAQRFNQFSLNLGIGFDTLQYVTDSYLLFCYPFLLEVPGYKVRAVGLSDAERDQNL